MLSKNYLGDGKVEVTFRMPPLDGVVELDLRGDFNGWDVKGVPLSLDADGTWVARIVLEAGRTYRYRYYDNQGTWRNDWEADAYAPNDYGSDDSVVDLTSSALRSDPPEKSKAEARERTAPAGNRGHLRKNVAGRRAKASS
jgi:1,4-alpha-glucan branching enzyme